MYCIDDTFYIEIDEIIGEYFENNPLIKSASDIPMDVKIGYYNCEPLPIYKLDSDVFYDMLLSEFEENSSEDGAEWERVKPLIEKHFNFDAFNAAAPNLWWPTGQELFLTYEELIEYANENKIFEL